MFTITLGNGNSFRAGRNGNNYLTGEYLADEVFDDGLEQVTITDDATDQTETMNDVEIIRAEVCGTPSVIFRERTDDDRLRDRIDAMDSQATYTAMMTDTLIEED